MTEFTPVSATIGGALIGSAAVLLMALNGRIAGISGIASGMMVAPVDDRVWRVLFVLGLIGGPFIWLNLTGITPEFTLNAETPVIVLGGLLVGFGTRLGAGCTSGHGVCGIARTSPRSIVSTLIFMTVAIATVAAVKYIGS